MSAGVSFSPRMGRVQGCHSVLGWGECRGVSFSPRTGRVQGCHSVLGWGEMFIHSHCMCAIVGGCIINHFLIASPLYPSPSIPFPTHPSPPLSSTYFTCSFRKEYEPLNLSTLQHFINSGRLDHSQPINMRTLHRAGAVGRIKHGVKLLAGVRLTMI